MVWSGALSSVKTSMEIGSVCKVVDSVGWAQRNPLFGINEDKWGLRFPDASNLFHKGSLTLLRDTSSSSIVFGHCVGPIFESAALARLYAALGCDVIGTGLLPDALVACHLKVPFVALGIVTHSLTRSKYEKPDDATIAANVTDPTKIDVDKLQQVVVGKKDIDALVLALLPLFQ
jgi:purine-nucleoside phosphorylase